MCNVINAHSDQHELELFYYCLSIVTSIFLVLNLGASKITEFSAHTRSTANILYVFFNREKTHIIRYRAHKHA